MAQIQHVNVGINKWALRSLVIGNIAFPLQLSTVVHPQSQQIPLCKALLQLLDQVPFTAVNQDMN